MALIVLSATLHWDVGTGPQVGVKELMEKALSRLAPNREPPGRVRARLEAALNRFADRYIFILNPLRDRDAREVAFAGLLRDVGEIEIEDDLGPINSERDDEVRVHHPFVQIDHEIGVEPVVKSAGALANGARLRLGPFCGERFCLQSSPVAAIGAEAQTG